MYNVSLDFEYPQNNIELTPDQASILLSRFVRSGLRGINLGTRPGKLISYRFRPRLGNK